MKWAFLLGSPDISGGTFVIFEHAVRARRRGVEVCIITEERVDKGRLFWHPEAKELCWKTFDEAAGQRFDVAIATWWPTVFNLHRVQAGAYAYFVQSIESRFCREDERLLRKLIDSTYMVPLRVITEAGWIKAHLEENYGLDVRVARNGIRKDIYTPDGEVYARREPGRLRVLVEGALGVQFKNVERTVELCRSSDADEVWLMTLTPVKEYPGVDRLFTGVPISETAKIYRSCDVIVKLSFVEGMFGPPLEMFHCGGTAVTYDVTGYDEYMVHGVNSLVARMHDERQVVSYINELKADPARLEMLKRAALKTAAGWPDWEEASLEFERAVRKIAGLGSITRGLLEKKTKFFTEFYEAASAAPKVPATVMADDSPRTRLSRYVQGRTPGLHSFLKRIQRALTG